MSPSNNTKQFYNDPTFSWLKDNEIQTNCCMHYKTLNIMNSLWKFEHNRSRNKKTMALWKEPCISSSDSNWQRTLAKLWTTPHTFCTQNFSFVQFSQNLCLPFVRVQHMFCRMLLYITYHELGEWKNVTMKKTVKMGTFVYKTYGELSTHLSECVANLSSP